MYSLILLFFTIPLYFSHVFAPFGLIIWETSSFERQKVYLFAIFVVISFLEICISRREALFAFFKSHIFSLSFFILLPFISLWLHDLPDISFFLSGWYEKHHGALWYLLFILLIINLSSLSPVAKKHILYASMYSAGLVAFFSLSEYILGSSFFFEGSRQISWWMSRSVSTLGNPNYVAWYLLLFLPLSSLVRQSERYIYILLIIFAVFTTGSYIALVLLWGYVVYWISSKFCKHFRWELLWTFILIVGLYGYWFLSPDKFLSLESRFVIMKEIWTVMVWYLPGFMTGFWPDSIMQYFFTPRSELISQYFPTESIIDSTHNIFLDFIFQFGVIAFAILAYYIWKRWPRLPRFAKESLLLGGLFLSLNVTVTVHVIMLILLLFLSP